MTPSSAFPTLAHVKVRDHGNRIRDLVERPLAVAGLLVSAPLLGGLMAAVRVLSGRPPLIALRRLGRNGTEFWMLKLRTMWDRTGHGPGERWPGGLVEGIWDAAVPPRKSGPDPRVTSRLAAFCRRYSLDELPQLIHVVSGTMSLAGPRPLTRVEIEEYYGEKAAEVLSVRPGCTGLWQVLGRNRLTYAQRRRLDLFFVRHRGVRLYLEILRRTPWRVISGSDAW
jgi:exopolysaccharide production protein ExoY